MSKGLLTLVGRLLADQCNHSSKLDEIIISEDIYWRHIKGHEQLRSCLTDTTTSLWVRTQDSSCISRGLCRLCRQHKLENVLQGAPLSRASLLQAAVSASMISGEELVDQVCFCGTGLAVLFTS